MFRQNWTWGARKRIFEEIFTGHDRTIGSRLLKFVWKIGAGESWKRKTIGTYRQSSKYEIVKIS